MTHSIEEISPTVKRYKLTLELDEMELRALYHILGEVTPKKVDDLTKKKSPYWSWGWGNNHKKSLDNLIYDTRRLIEKTF